MQAGSELSGGLGLEDTCGMGLLFLFSEFEEARIDLQIEIRAFGDYKFSLSRKEKWVDIAANYIGKPIRGFCR